jgi:DNA-binding transcriptional ArsR family regulator
MKNNRVNIDSQKLFVSSEILRALAHPLRLKIIEFIDQSGRINVNKIYNNLKLEQSITSQHLKIMREAGVLETTRNGKFIYYNLNYDCIANTVVAVKNYVESIEKKTKHKA